MTVNSSEECMGIGMVEVLIDEATPELQCDSLPSLSSLLEVSKSIETHICLDSRSDLQDHMCINMDDTDSYSACIVDMDKEKEKYEAPKSNDETVVNLKTEDPLNHLQREISFHMGGKFMQLLINHSLALPKFTARDKSATEKTHEMPNNRSRKYKRSASFNSRKVVLLFSVLSSLGTMILIYLTLRVRQMGDVSIHT